MVENIIHSILQMLHNIALVGCAAAPFNNRNLVNNRSQYDAKSKGKTPDGTLGRLVKWDGYRVNNVWRNLLLHQKH